MSLYLVESVLTSVVKEQASFEEKAAAIQESLSSKGAALIEIQVSTSLYPG